MGEETRIDELLSRYLDGAISEADLRVLEETLLADRDAADRFAQWCLMHRQVSEVLTEDRLHDLIHEFLSGGPGPPEVFARIERERGGRSPRAAGAWATRRSRFVWAAGAVAACVVVAALVATRPGPDDPQSAERRAAITPTAATADESGAVASLSRLFEPVWAADATPLQHGQSMAAGARVALRSGRAKVTFDSGAEVFLEGPCDFEVRSRMAGVLNAGQITASVPPRGFAFAVLCPGVDLVDLGTSFGVSVGANGATELHVFEGEVLCSPAPSGEQRPGEAIHVRANRAMQFGAGGESPSDIVLNTGKFSDLLSMRGASASAQDRLPPRDLALWLNADVGVTTDARGRVVAWQDIVYGDNASAEDALQPDEEARPLLVQKAVGGRAAVRFDGASDFVLTTPLQTTDNQTVLLVCQFSPSALSAERVWGGQILNYDGPPSRYLSDTLEPGVLQIGEPLLEEEFQPTLLSGQVFAGFIGRATVEAGRVDAEPVGVNAPVVVSYLYDYDNKRAELRINGRSCGTARAFAPQEVTSRKIIGRHAWMQNFFHGDLAELLIYNRALPDAELDAATAYLAEEYAAPLAAP